MAAAELQEEQDLVVVDATAGSARWYVISDKIVGGQFRSFVEFQPGDPGHVKFHGTLRANDGVFCQAISHDFPSPLDLSAYAGITIEVRSQTNRKYKFGLRDIHSKNDILWEAVFEAPASPSGSTAWNRIEIPFSRFAPHTRNSSIEPGVMDLTHVHNLVLGLSKFDYHLGGDKVIRNHRFKEGRFELLFKDVKAYGQESAEVTARRQKEEIQRKLDGLGVASKKKKNTSAGEESKAGDRRGPEQKDEPYEIPEAIKSRMIFVKASSAGFEG